MGACGPPSDMRITIPYQRSKNLRNTIHADTDNPDKFTLQTTEDVSGIIDYCAAKQEATRFDRDDGLRHVAEIPVSIYEQAVFEGWDNPEGWRRWLNDPDNACFRTWRGKV
jgi:hypothetical protein